MTESEKIRISRNEYMRNYFKKYPEKRRKAGVRGGTEPKTAIIFTKSVNLF